MHATTYSSTGIQPSGDPSHKSQNKQQHNNATKNHVADACSMSVATNQYRVTIEDINCVQRMVEICLKMYKNKEKTATTLLKKAGIVPGYTRLVWERLEQHNSDFFRSYYIRLELMKQIRLFNHLLEHQANMMPQVPPMVPLDPVQNVVRPPPVENMPVLLHPPMAPSGQSHFDPVAYGMSSHHGVNGVPAQGNLDPMSMYSGNDMLIDNGAAGFPPVMYPSNTMPAVSKMPLSNTPVSSSGQFIFSASDMMSSEGLQLPPENGTSTIRSLGQIPRNFSISDFTSDATFTSDMMMGSEGPQLPPENGTATTRSFEQIPRNFSLPDLTADISDLGDLGALGNYPGSPFLNSNFVSDFLLDFPGQDYIMGDID